MSDAASEIARLSTALAAQTARAQAAEAELAQARALASCTDAMIQELKLEIAKLRRDKYGISSERRTRLIDQLELQLEELEAAATEDALAAEQAADKASAVRAFTRRKPVRKPFPDHLPRERVVVEAPAACTCCGSDRIVKMGEDVTETLEVIPRQWKVIQTVREKFTCRACEKISQPPAPFHAIPRGWAGPQLIAMIAFDKYGQHQPLNRQSERIAREGVDLSLSTLADLIGHACVALTPIHALIARHVLDAGRLHGDDTTVPLLARGGAKTARLWTYVRDDRPWDGGAPPAALFHFSTDRRKEHPTRHLAEWHGVLQSDVYGGYNDLYLADRSPGPVRSALCWSHARRKFFELADIKAIARKGKKVAKEISPIALDAVTRIDAIFAAERDITGLSDAARHEARQQWVAPMVNDLHDWMLAERARMSKHNPVAKAINYMLEGTGRWEAFTAFLDDGRLCLTNNAAERALRGIALGRKSWLFAGSERGGDRAAFMYTLIVTAKMNDIDPQAWMADVLARLPDMPVSRLPELLPWNWKAAMELKRIAA
ncbi:IS66 family transposase [Sulfitobacter sp. SK025]|uniref:IS66 family transposase n=1 Tax=Sulfitobacter sp. SK025 TaxID=1389011 RepID=UPI000E0C585F|nr:IS66 family transposase [Sulfitobacter sp. SK025]AXI52024.1 IS66 family transposase [Sulfitobacter sp. SK025]AXI52455.1 IS66 family transposase [Sulfitobacter sp. SK025]AXI52482.1 IS66 family transposase [Sulfitobacter sp. SK025]AXI52523.1 IS66 family transposase [Sulfitobacter sp. SK025]AXI52835.1 IS66 family transposase [Sulfitobacter sp. SK025]